MHFAFWTLAHQISTFYGISWTVLTQNVIWTLPAVVVFAYWHAGHVAKLYAQRLPKRLLSTCELTPRNGLLACLTFLGMCIVLNSFTARFTLIILCLITLVLFAWGRPIVIKTTTVRLPYDDLPAWRAYLYLFAFMSITVLIVLCANRSDFDDAEYIQCAIQTLRHPARGLFTFDASLGVVSEQFRFAPYRITSYETFIALITQWTGINILDVYYLLLPASTAALSILVAFVFLRWFLPMRWSLLAIFLFLLISFSWGETHTAYGNRMYVRLFQGKGLLVAITTPLTIIMALLWLRRPSLHTWFALFFMQVIAVGVSSSGLVITLFSTALGLLAGFFSQPSQKTLWAGFSGGATLVYPIGLGLWVKYMSSASGKVEDIGTYLPINASLGGSWREALTLMILISACFITFRVTGNALRKMSSGAIFIKEKTFFWLVLFSFLIILNPFLIEHLSTVTSKNMNWRLAWAAPIPLLLSISMVYLCRWSQANYEKAFNKISWILPTGLIVAFAVGPWTLSKNNLVHWGFFERKLPPEYQQAVVLSQEVRRLTVGRDVITVLVEPRVGTWLTVVAPDFKLIMPGHGYWITLSTIMDKKDFAQRNQLVSSIDAIAAGDASLEDLLDFYGVDVIAVKNIKNLDSTNYSLQIRSIK